MAMIFNPFVAQRKEQKLQLLELIQKNPDMDPQQLIALFSLKTGLKRRTILEMWEELQEAGVIKNGGRPVNKAMSERGREAVKRLNERSSGTDTNS